MYKHVQTQWLAGATGGSATLVAASGAGGADAAGAGAAASGMEIG